MKFNMKAVLAKTSAKIVKDNNERIRRNNAKKKADAKKNKMNPKPLSRPDKNHKKIVKKLG